MSQAQVEEYFVSKERELETLYSNSTLPAKPDKDKIKGLLLACLEHAYGSLDKCVVIEDDAVRALDQIQTILDSVQRLK